MSKLQHIDDLKEYMEKRKQAFESKLGYGENPIPDMHFCNNSKYLDSMSQDIIKSCLKIKIEGGSLRDQLFNVACYRFLIDRVMISEMTGGTGVFLTEKFEEYVDYVANWDKYPKARYRVVLQNATLWNRSREELFSKNIPNVVNELEKMVGFTQTQVRNSEALKEILGVADFTAYQFSSDLLYIPEMQIKVDYVEYHSAGTAQGFEILTGSKEYDKLVIDMIIDINSKLNHLTRYTKYMIPTDACNVLCEFKKYMSGKKRSRSSKLDKNYSINTFDYDPILVPEAIAEWCDGR